MLPLDPQGWRLRGGGVRMGKMEVCVWGGDAGSDSDVPALH